MTADMPVAEIWVAAVALFVWWACREPKPSR